MKTIRACLVSAVFCGLALAQGDFQKGLSYYKQGQYEKAITEFEEIVKESPDYEDGYRILGDSYYRTKQYDKAIKAFSEAVRLKPDNFTSEFGLGLAQHNAGHHRDAVATLLKAERHAVNPADKLNLYRVRGTAHFKLKEYQEALNDLDRAQEIRRGRAEDLLLIGISHFQLGHSADAEQFLNQVVSLDPQNAEASRFLSLLEYQRAQKALVGKDYKTAAELFNAYLARNPEDGEAWFNLGLAHERVKNYTLAERAFVESGRLLEGHAETFDHLGFVYELTRKYDKALSAYQKAYEISSDAESKKSVDRIKERLRRRREGQ